MTDDEHLREQLELLMAEEKAKRLVIALTAVGAVVLVFVLVLVLLL
jgi:hypothetical protein